MAFDEALHDLHTRRERVRRNPARQGKMSARERIAYLLDPDSFMEIGTLAHSDMPGEAEKTPADSKVTGFGRIGGRNVGIIAADFTVKAATSSRVGSKKERSVTELCERNGCPLIYLGEAGGARMPDIMGAIGLATYGGTHAGDDSFVGALTRRRSFPLVVAIMGDAFGEPTWMAALADFVVMTKGACLAVAGPRVLEVATAETVDPEALGGWELHATITGMADEVAEDDARALDTIRTYLGYMPQHNGQKTPPAAVPDGSGEMMPRILDILPEKQSKTYDMYQLLAPIVDKESLFPIKKRFGKSVITALARINGETVGIIASQPRHLGGAMDTDAIDKATSFICLCDSFNIPLIFVQDTPGFVVGPVAERNRAGAKIITFLEALGQAGVPKITIIVRKSYGMAFYNMGGTGTGATFIVAWPTAEISFVADSVSVNVVYGRQIQAAADPEAERERLREKMRNESSPYAVAGQHLIHEVIEPSETRAFLIRALDIGHDNRSGGISQHRLANWPKKF